MSGVYIPWRLDAGAWTFYRINMNENRNRNKNKKTCNKNYDELYERLAAYGNSDYYPFHMPGHKRMPFAFENPYKIDITEIEGFDNLHDARDILKKSQDRLKNLFQSRKSYFLINGSTCGLFIAIGALTKRGDHILLARNCHKSVYHAAKIFGLKTDYVYPKILECGIQGAIGHYDVEKALQNNQNIRVVVLTSPTYDGIVSDIAKIAQIVHKHYAYLIVDEAHGAHFSFSSHFPVSALRKGADIVVHSLHKTLTGFTQTAALHITGEKVDCRRIEEMSGIFQSSSPSYLLMAGIERCIKLLEDNKEILFEQYYEKLAYFYEQCGNLKNLHILTKNDYMNEDIFDADLSKILICTRDTPINGKRLYRKLLEQYHLQMEMYSAEYVLGMTSIMDTEEGLGRLMQALKETDTQLHPFKIQTVESKYFLETAYAARKKVLEISDTDYYNKEETPFKECIGKVCAEYISIYPPGIPLIVPGEEITDELLKTLEDCKKYGLHVQGMNDKQHRKILTVAQMQENRI